MAVTEDANVANVDWNRGIRMQLQPRQRVIANKKNRTDNSADHDLVGLAGFEPTTP